MDDEDAGERASLTSSSSRTSHATNTTGVADVYPSAAPEDDSKSRLSRRWISIYIMYFTMFIGAITFSIVISSLFPFLRQISHDKGGTILFGIVIAAYSAGQLVASPIFGFWSDKRPTREPLIVSLSLSIITNILYSYTQVFPVSFAKYVMIAARALVGFAAGNAAVARSYVSAATTEAERVGAFAGISASQAIGFIIGPVLGLSFVPLHSSGIENTKPYFFFNMYTGPGFLSAFLAAINLILVVFLFKERRLNKLEDTKLKPLGRSNYQSVKVTSSSINQSLESSTFKYDRFGAYICVVLFFAVLFVFAVFETIVTPYSMDEFAWSKQQGVLYNNIMFGALAIIAIFAFIILKYVSKCFDERVLFVCGLFITALGFFALIPMGDEKPDIGIQFIENIFNNSNSSSMTLLSNSTEPVGCRYPKLKWCLTLPKLTIYQYVAGMVMTAIGYPVSSVLCYSLFSKIIGPNPQGIMMGILTATGSLARIVGPLFVTFVYDIAGPQITMGCVIGILAVAILILTSCCYRLVPFNTPKGCPAIINKQDKP